jgi:1,4-alpha-glucan branching enzyme
LPPTAFLAFLQNHDQVGNRARGERIHECTHRSALRAATEVLLLNPMPPLLFMGQEWLASSRFPFFCDYRGELAEAVREGRLREFAAFDGFGGPQAHAAIPDPVAFDTFLSAKLDWQERLEGEHGDWWRLFQQLLALRRRHLVPLLALPPEKPADYGVFAERAVQVRWYLGAGARYTLSLNLGDQPVTGVPPGDGTLLYATPALPERRDAVLPPWSTRVYLQTGAARTDTR